MIKSFAPIGGHHGQNGVLVLPLVKLACKNLLESDDVKKLKIKDWVLN